MWPSSSSASASDSTASSLSSTTSTRRERAVGTPIGGVGPAVAGAAPGRHRGGPRAASGRRTRSSRAAPGPGAARLDAAAVQPDERSHDGQPEPEPALRSIQRLPLLHEQVEDPRQHLGADADAGVAHDDQHAAVVAPRAARRCRPRGGVYLAALVSRFANTCASRAGSASTASPRRDVDRQVVLALLDERAGHLQRARQHVAELDAHALERDLAARDARHLEQIVDQAHQVLDLALDDRALLEQHVAARAAA